MRERLVFNSRTLRATAAAFALASCSDSSDSGARQPNINAPVVQQDLENRSNEYAFAYGIGLRAGCDSDEFIEDNELKSDTAVAEAYEEALQRNPEETLVGFTAGVERGLAEEAAGSSEVC